MIFYKYYVSFHMMNITNEHENGQYIKIKDTQSILNPQIQKITDSSFVICWNVYFTKKIQLNINLQIFNEDYNRNIIMNCYNEYSILY